MKGRILLLLGHFHPIKNSLQLLQAQHTLLPKHHRQRPRVVLALLQGLIYGGRWNRQLILQKANEFRVVAGYHQFLYVD